MLLLRRMSSHLAINKGCVPEGSWVIARGLSLEATDYRCNLLNNLFNRRLSLENRYTIHFSRHGKLLKNKTESVSETFSKTEVDLDLIKLNSQIGNVHKTPQSITEIKREKVEHCPLSSLLDLDSRLDRSRSRSISRGFAFQA